jgi:hypothetical protein
MFSINCIRREAAQRRRLSTQRDASASSTEAAESRIGRLSARDATSSSSSSLPSSMVSGLSPSTARVYARRSVAPPAEADALAAAGEKKSPLPRVGDEYSRAALLPLPNPPTPGPALLTLPSLVLALRRNG